MTNSLQNMCLQIGTKFVSTRGLSKAEADENMTLEDLDLSVVPQR